LVQEIDKQAFYDDPKVREILRGMLMINTKLDPIIGQDGKIHYELVDKVLGKDINVISLLEKMTEVGILKRSAEKPILRCPEHDRADPLVELLCLHCGSKSLKKTVLFEHRTCGFIGEDFRFGDEMERNCPKCKKAVAGSDLRVTGAWYVCQSCKNRTSTPKVGLVCREGLHSVSLGEVDFLQLFSYELVDVVSKELRTSLLLLPSVAQLFFSLGYQVSYPASIKGKSGVEHRVDLYAKKTGDDVMVQISTESMQVDVNSVVSFFAKLYDVQAKHALMVAIPTATDAAKRVAESYGIQVIEGPDETKVTAGIKAALISSPMR